MQGAAKRGIPEVFKRAARLLQAGHESAVKQPADDVHGKEEIARGFDPLALVVREATARYDAMETWG